MVEKIINMTKRVIYTRYNKAIKTKVGGFMSLRKWKNIFSKREFVKVIEETVNKNMYYLLPYELFLF